MPQVLLYVYCGSNPILNKDPSGRRFPTNDAETALYPQALQRQKAMATARAQKNLLLRSQAQTELQSILIGQYPIVEYGLLTPFIHGIMMGRLTHPFDLIANNRGNIATASAEFGVPQEAIGSIILKEQFTQSLPDQLSMLVNAVLPGERTRYTATVGLGAISVRSAQTAWSEYEQEFQVPGPDFLGNDNKMLDELTHDDNFQVQTIAVMLLYNGSQDAKLDPHTAMSWTNADWRETLHGYNSIKGYDYADKVLQYFGPMKTFLS